MINKQEVIEFNITIIKCFAVFLLLGLFLPKIIDYALYKLINNTNIYKNSIFVYNVINRNINFIYNYIYIFKQFLSL
ncbi:hypothetical protein CLOACE_02140 [Clostridium acetireducens DSM 10703]|uniref:Uncharacterized protein n=1 Tax=Clostridium acetireducens DSM 10703 TaxID=1121290 RepID=A0A1E8F1Y0_9CLOT|nr:hypothetical protein CLOACE_02140 [Clostridium acetireducens DSM 10703]